MKKQGKNGKNRRGRRLKLQKKGGLRVHVLVSAGILTAGLIFALGTAMSGSRRSSEIRLSFAKEKDDMEQGDILSQPETGGAESGGSADGLTETAWETEAGCETESETESETETEYEEQPVSETQPVTEPDAVEQPASEMQMITEPNAVEQPASETQPITEANATNQSASETQPVTEANATEQPASEIQPIAESNAGEQSVFEAQPVTEPDTVEQPASETQMITEPNAVGQPASETQPITEMNATEQPASEEQLVTEQASELQPETESTSGTEPCTEAQSVSEDGSQMEEGLQSESGFQENAQPFENESQSESETESRSESETGSQYEFETGSQSESESESQSESETEPQSESELRPEPEPQPEPETEPQPENEELQPGTEEPQPETAPPPSPIQRGKDYEIRGDSNAWYRDAGDRLWVRSGSNVYVEPAGGAQYNRGGSVRNVTQDGSLTFQLSQTDEQGRVTHISELQKEPYYVDGEAPEAVLRAEGVQKNGTTYAAQSAAVQIAIEPDGKSGLKRAAYCVRRCGTEDDAGAGNETDWLDCADGQQLAIQEEGVWQVYVRTEDQVGNLRFSKSEPICVDRTPPEIRIEGVLDQTANSGGVPIQISCQDPYYRQGSLEIVFQGANSGQVPQQKKTEESVEGASVEYFDFPEDKMYDDAYRLRVQAQDLAGNTTVRTLEFSVNRFGSVYDLSEQTKQTLEQYYLTEPSEIVFLETNIDYVGESEIFCRKNGELKQLKRGTDYQVMMQGSRDSWKQYQYTISAAYFKEEGVYELLLSSRDQAENESDTGLQGKRVTFVLDWTEPSCLVTGISEGETYEAERVTACFQPTDNVGIRFLRLYEDSELVKEVTERSALEEPVKLDLDAGNDWKTIQVQVGDLAGNEYWSQEIPVYIGMGESAILPYEKVRASAREKEAARLLSLRDDSKAELRLTGAPEAAETAETVAGKVQEAERYVEAARGDSDGENRTGLRTLFSTDVQERERRGKLLLCFGAILFGVTLLVCLLPFHKHKK